MPRFCAVVGCGKRGDRDARTNSFYRLPCIPKKGDTCLTTLKTKRRMAWILALRRADMTETKLKYAVICDRHFISGQPASSYDIENPDWVPSINMGYDTKNSRKKLIPQKPVVEYLCTSSGSKQKKTPEVTRDTNMNFADAPQSSTSKSKRHTSKRTYETESDDSEEDVDMPGVCFDSDEEYAPKIFSKRKLRRPQRKTASSLTTAEKNRNVADMFSEENILQKYVLSELNGEESEFNENMMSKKVQTDFTMIDLENLSNAFKDSAAEVSSLKEKLKILSQDVLFLDDNFYS